MVILHERSLGTGWSIQIIHLSNPNYLIFSLKPASPEKGPETISLSSTTLKLEDSKRKKGPGMGFTGKFFI